MAEKKKLTVSLCQHFNNPFEINAQPKQNTITSGLKMSFDEGIQTQGRHSIDSQTGMPGPGIYYYKMIADGFSTTRKMLVRQMAIMLI